MRFSDPAKAAAQDDEDGLDEFLSSHGFEYIDGDRSGRQPTQDGTSFSDEDSSGASDPASASELTAEGDSQVCPGCRVSSTR